VQVRCRFDAAPSAANQDTTKEPARKMQLDQAINSVYFLLNLVRLL
jgi:hypothetical protein